MFQMWKHCSQDGAQSINLQIGQYSATEQSPMVLNNPERYLSNGRQTAVVSHSGDSKLY